MAGEADSFSSVSSSACHIGGPIGVNPGELTLVYGSENPHINAFKVKVIEFRESNLIFIVCWEFFYEITLIAQKLQDHKCCILVAAATNLNPYFYAIVGVHVSLQKLESKVVLETLS